MAPRKPKPADDDASSTTSELQVLKPKTEKAKVEKVKSEKAKTAKAKAVKKEKTGPDGEKGKKGEGDGGGKKGGEKGEKEKVKAVTGEEAVGILGRYLREQNRPYSATEISANLHGQVSSFHFFFGSSFVLGNGSGVKERWMEYLIHESKRKG